MQSQDQENPQFMITKEVFIDHIPREIEQYYEVNPNCLGQGGFGKVFEAKKKKKSNEFANQDLLGTSFSSFETSSRQGEDDQNHTDIRAIKQIGFQRPEDKERMKNEIEILSYLDHPSILKLYETYEHKKQLYLVTDLLKGGDLFTVIDEKSQVNEQQVKVIFKQLIKALNYLHSQHICHRDLKLQNILFLDKNSYNVKLIDFGLAFCWDEDMKKELKQNGQNKKMIGTPDYMSPEMLSHNYDQRCDIWSAGVILYILLSKVPPFFGNSDKQIIQKVKNIDYTFQIPEFKEVSQCGKEMIQKMLKPQNQRIALSEILSHEWLKESGCSCGKCFEGASTQSISSTAKRSQIFSEQQRKFKTTRSFGRVNRKNSFQTYDNSQFEGGCISHGSQQLSGQERMEQLTVQKLQNYTTLTKLQKLYVIYSVSKLSEMKTKSYGNEFILIDKNNDGVISLQDLTEYLFQMETFCDKQKTEFYFNQLALSQRGYISYTQYLACVLSYDLSYKNHLNSEQLQFDERFTYTGKSLFLTDDILFADPIDLYEESTIYDLFCLLDKDRDGYISKQDFIQLLQNNGIDELNDSLLEQIDAKIHQLNKVGPDFDEQSQDAFEWEEDPRKFKQLLSRTYKGESDGGTHICFRQFKHLMKSHQRCTL